MSSAPSSAPYVPTVLVTGAGRRLGREIALALATAGWRVAVHYRDSEQDAIKKVADCTYLTGGAAAFRADLSKGAAVRALLPAVVQTMVHVEIDLRKPVAAALRERNMTAA